MSTRKDTRSPALTTDALVFVSPSKMVLIRRGRPPFQGMWALPGGFVDYGERVEEAVLREVREETGIVGRLVGLLGVYSDPLRDPRGHTVSVVYVVVGREKDLRAGDDAREIRIVSFPPDLPLAFDHSRIVEDAASWLKKNPLPEDFWK